MSVLSNPWDQFKKDSKPEVGDQGHIVAPLLDRVAAGFIDFVIILLLLNLLVSPLKKDMIIALLVNDMVTYSMNLMKVLIIAVTFTVFYQTLFIWYRGATIGKMMFKIQVVHFLTYKRLSFYESFFRGLFWTLSLPLLGLPFLGVLSNSLRRPFYDRLTDSICMTSKNLPSQNSTYNERMFARGLYSFIFSFLIFGIFLQVSYFVQQYKTQNDLFGAFETENYACEEVSNAQEVWPRENGFLRESRLNIALTMYAAEMIDDECLDMEARRAFFFNEDLEKANLARAFVTSHNADYSDNYLTEVCKIDSDSGACQLSRVIVLWSEKEWDKATEAFQQVDYNNHPYVRVWAVKHYEKIKNFEAELKMLAELWPNKVLSEYIGTHRAIALWEQGKTQSSREAFLGAVNFMEVEDVESFSSWFCDHEVEQSCVNKNSISCKIFHDIFANVDLGLMETDSALTYLKTKECEGSSKEAVAEIKGKTLDPNFARYLDAVELSLQDAQSGKEKLRKLLKSLSDSEKIYYEVQVLLLEHSSSKEEILDIEKEWANNNSFGWYWSRLGRRIMNKYESHSHYSNAIEVGRRILRSDPENIKVYNKLVVNNYKLGRKNIARDLLSNKKGRVPASVNQFEDIRIELLQSKGRE